MRDYIIVGCGITGSVIAHELAKNGNRVFIFERRGVRGGNMYDYTDEYGIRVQKYGPHIFHTNDDEVWKYVTDKCEMKDFNLVCGSVIDGKCLPVSFDFSSVDFLFPEEAEVIKERIRQVFKGRDSASILELLDCGDEYIVKYAKVLYDKDYAPYTAKQWGISPEQVDRNVFKRVPILFSYNGRYFTDKYQGMPVNGYMELFDNLLRLPNISVRCGANLLDCMKADVSAGRIMPKTGPDEKTDVTVIYTGPLDELFNCCYGALPYRSLRFEVKHEDIESFQEMPVVAYPLAKGYTRITEYKKLPVQNVRGTTYAVEYPVPYDGLNKMAEPYYPVITEESSRVYSLYRELAEKIENLVVCGRLADFKYYNMDEAIKRALQVADGILQKG